MGVRQRHYRIRRRLRPDGLCRIQDGLSFGSWEPRDFGFDCGAVRVDVVPILDHATADCVVLDVCGLPVVAGSRAPGPLSVVISGSRLDVGVGERSCFRHSRAPHARL